MDYHVAPLRRHFRSQRYYRSSVRGTRLAFSGFLVFGISALLVAAGLSVIVAAAPLAAGAGCSVVGILLAAYSNLRLVIAESNWLTIDQAAFHRMFLHDLLHGLPAAQSDIDGQE